MEKTLSRGLASCCPVCSTLGPEPWCWWMRLGFERRRSKVCMICHHVQAGTGTDPQQGAALARAMLEALVGGGLRQLPKSDFHRQALKRPHSSLYSWLVQAALPSPGRSGADPHFHLTIRPSTHRIRMRFHHFICLSTCLVGVSAAEGISGLGGANCCNNEPWLKTVS